MENNLKDRQDPGILEIVWVDSLVINHGEWMDLDDLKDNIGKENLLHTTVGYLVGESDDAIVLGQSINAQEGIPTNRVSGGMVIPKVAILERTVLREKT